MPRRIYRVKELAAKLSTRDCVIAIDPSSLQCALGDSGVLVGQFYTKREALKRFPESRVESFSAAICFCDSSGAIPCELVEFDTRLLGLTVYLTVWSLVRIQSGDVESDDQPLRCYLEVGNNQSIFPVSSPLKDIRDYRTNFPVDGTPNANEFLKSASKADVTPPVNFDYLSLEGVVRAKSVMTMESHQYTFFVEFQIDTPSSVVCGNRFSKAAYVKVPDAIPAETVVLTAFVLYQQSLPSSHEILPLYASIHVGQRYRCTGLKVASVRNSGADSATRRVFLFTISSSSMTNLKYSTESDAGIRKDTRLLANLIDNDSKSHAIPLKGHAPTISYSGCITKHVDVKMGIFQLDNRFLLFTTFHHLSGAGRGLRVGAQLSLHNIHAVSCLTNLYGEKTKKRVVLVACSYTSVKFERFSEKVSRCFITSNQDRKEALKCWANCNIPDILLAQQLQRALDEIVGIASLQNLALPRSRESIESWCQVGACELMVSFNHVPWIPKRETAFTSHNTECDTANYRYSIPKLSHLSDIIASLDKFLNSESKKQLRKGWTCTTVDIRNLTLNPRVLMCIRASASGQFELFDTSGSIEVEVTSSMQQLLEGPTLALLADFQIIVERWHDISEGKLIERHRRAYVSVTRSNILWSKAFVDRCTTASPDRILMRISHISPLRQERGVDQEPSLNCTVEGLFTPVGGPKVEPSVQGLLQLTKEWCGARHILEIDKMYVLEQARRISIPKKSSSAPALETIVLSLVSESSIKLLPPPQKSTTDSSACLTAEILSKVQGCKETLRDVGAVLSRYRHEKKFGESLEHLASFRGILIERDADSCSDDRQRMASGTNPPSVSKKIGLSLVVRDLCGGETLRMHLRLQEHNYCFGLLPGRRINVYGATLYTAQNGYIEADSRASTLIRSDPDYECPPSENQKLYLRLCHITAPDLVLSAQYTVRCILKWLTDVRISCECKNCGLVCINSQCLNLCNVGYELKAIARAVVEDGSSEVTVVAEGLQPVCSILGQTETSAEITKVLSMLKTDGSAKFQAVGNSAANKYDQNNASRLLAKMCQNPPLFRELDYVCSNNGRHSQPYTKKLQMRSFKIESGAVITTLSFRGPTISISDLRNTVTRENMAVLLKSFE
ncbi:hypothetical protein DFS34DRAFT_594043 [Phlyctochytrium arcticum]|nr:hypothetical protein DFS34DRAFT_594043 [Phlyctochytrium arcticum]